MPTLAEQNRLHQQRHREKLIAKMGLDEYKKMIRIRMKEYRADRKASELLDTLTLKHTPFPESTPAPPLPPVPKPTPTPTPKTVEIPSIITEPTREQPKDLKFQVEKLDIAIPSHISRKKPLQPSSIQCYISAINVIHKFLTSQPLSSNLKDELFKLFSTNTFDDKLLLTEMSYINDAETVVKKLREKYYNDKTFNNYVSIISIIISYYPQFYETYLKINKLYKQMDKQFQDARGDNIAKHTDKIIDLSNRQVLLDNIDKLTDINDKALYAIHTLIPPRRLENRLLQLTEETNLDNLMNATNYLITNGDWKLLYNEYKTAEHYGSYVVDVPDDLKRILQMYIITHKLRQGDYLFSQVRNKQKVLSAPNFSSKISKVFELVYGVKICNKFLRYSVATNATNTLMSKTERTKLAHDMGHSLTENLTYSKHK